MDIRELRHRLAGSAVALEAEPEAPSNTHLAFDQAGFGANIRKMRMQRGWTLRDLSERSKISQSTLSRVETGQIMLAFDRVHALARALDADFSKFLQEMGGVEPPPTPAPVHAGWRSISRRSEGHHVVQNNADYEYLCNDFLCRKLVTGIATVTARSLEEHGPFVTHPGEEFTYVLSGTIVIATQFYVPVTLEAGDSMQYDSMTPHAVYSTSEEPARCLICVTDPRWD
jgi:transcriptional regulator with XRE-family HTH domain